jgi:creatinine amidohydrolase
MDFFAGQKKEENIMTALFLDQLTWPEIKAEIQKGRDTVIVPFGSTEQHGRHLPIAVDAVLGDVFGWKLAERLCAFLAPTVRYGCSEHHLAFAGTISLKEETFQRVVADIVSSLSRHGFRRIVLFPTHGGNFQPLAKALANIKPIEGLQILAFTDVTVFLKAGFDGGHAGIWETSLMLALKPEQVKMNQATAGFSGQLPEILAKFSAGAGVETLDENGVLGNPLPATPEAGMRYLDDIIEFCYKWVLQQGTGR